MADLHSQGAFVLRTPALPFAAWAALEGDPEAARALFGTPAGRDALAVASPDTLAALERDDPDVGDALLRFAARMAARPTPFGLFAGWSTGAVGDDPVLQVGEGRPRSRLDMHVLLAVAEHARRDPEVRRVLTFHPNPGLYRLGGRLRHVMSTHADGATRHRLIATRPDDDLELVLATARDGARWDDLAAALRACGVAPEAVEPYLETLAGRQLLVADLALPVTGPEPARPLARRLRELGADTAADALDAVVDRLEAADTAPPGGRAAAHRDVAAALAPLGIAAPAGRLVQVDLPRDAPGLTLPGAMLEDLRRGVELLRRLTPAAPGELAAFRERFAARYDTRPVPLTEALDPDAGIGYEAGTHVAAMPPPVPERDALLLSLLLEATASGAREVELDPGRLAGLPAAPLPGAFAVLAVPGPDGDVHPRFVTGPSGATLLGRFCHADPTLEAAVRDHLAAEAAREPDDVVLAELVHLPEGRTGNVLLRPRLREHEIVVDASAAASPGALTPGDLTLGLEDGALVLRAARLDGRRVLPRLTTAHDHAAGSIGLYRLLAALAAQDVAPALAWSWGALADGAGRLPRVRCGRVVLEPARWRVPDDLEDVGAWRAATGVPRIVAVGHGDAPLPLDLGTAHGHRELRRQRPVWVAEWWPDPEALPVADAGGGRLCAEVVVPFTRPPDAEPARSGRPPVALPVRRRFPPGSPWLTAKLYAGAALHDDLIVRGLAPLARAAVGHGRAAGWHVLRYADADGEHLRIRLQGEPATLRERVQPELEALAAAALADGRAWRLVLDTYEREVERYGDVEAAEAVFHADSDRVATLLDALPRGASAAAGRWVDGAGSALRLILDLGVTPDEAGQVLEACRGPLAPDGRAALAAAQRRERPRLEARVAAALDAPREPLPAVPRRAIPSLVHLHLNRLLRFPGGDVEVAACDAAARTLRSLRARAPTPLP